MRDKLRVLLVDDHAMFRESLARVLEKEPGISVVGQSATCAEALSKLADEPDIELLLLDINMPVMDGLEFIKQLPTVANAKGVPVVMITTEGSESHVVEALSHGARGYIRKPFTAEQVKEHVVPVLGGKS